MTNKELQNQLDELQMKYEQVQSELEAIKSQKRQEPSFEDIKSYDRLKVLTLKAGIQIFSTTTSLTGFEGELIIVSDTDRLAYYRNGSWH